MALNHKNYNPDLMYGATDADTTTPQAISSASNQAFAVGLNGATNPAFNVDSSTALQADGLNVVGAAAGSGAAVSVITSGTNSPLTIDAAGSGTITLAGTSTGIITSPRTYASTSTGGIESRGTGKVGYGTGAGGAVTQATNRSTGVTINKVSGTITTNTTSLAAGASAEFTVTNSTVAIGDVIVVCQQSGSSNAVSGVAGVTIVTVTTVAAGSFIISVTNTSTTTAETGAIIINFAVIKAVSA